MRDGKIKYQEIVYFKVKMLVWIEINVFFFMFEYLPERHEFDFSSGCEINIARSHIWEREMFIGLEISRSWNNRVKNRPKFLLLIIEINLVSSDELVLHSVLEILMISCDAVNWSAHRIVSVDFIRMHLHEILAIDVQCLCKACG